MGITTYSHMQATAKKKKPFAPRDLLPGENLTQFFAHLSVSFWTSFIARIPLGYQNETGFHFGSEPRPERLLEMVG
jgi:hypothetical protein